jgi:hypothetical protein
VLAARAIDRELIKIHYPHKFYKAIQNSKIKMENDNVKFKNEFKKRLYNWVLRLIKFIDKLPQDSICKVLGKQLLRSGTSILANYIEANSASSKKILSTFSLMP